VIPKYLKPFSQYCDQNQKCKEGQHRAKLKTSLRNQKSGVLLFEKEKFLEQKNKSKYIFERSWKSQGERSEVQQVRKGGVKYDV